MGPLGGVPGESFVQLSAGGSYTCGIKADGSAWCWGSNDEGQLGVGDTVNRNQPTQITEDGPWAMISTSSNRHEHTCGIKTDGTAWCWGDDGNGQLGNGSGITGDQYDPVQISEAGPWKTISVSSPYQYSEYTCAVKVDGTAWCWGLDDYGQLGNGAGTSGDQQDPVQISEAGPWDSISVGNYFACGVKTDGTGWCWGSDSRGRLGNGTGNGDQEDPMQITEAGPWDSISAGRESACGLKSDSSVWCWGYDGSGELGYASSGSDQHDPVQISEAGPWDSISAGTNFNCGVKSDGTAWCWGGDWFGQIGCDGCSPTNIPVQITDAGPWDMITTGNGHTCGVKTGGASYCWGSDDDGQLGKAYPHVPMPIAEDGPWSTVSAGERTGCAIKTADDSSWCWGVGGSLGGPEPASDVPAQLSESGPWDFIDSGYGMSCGVKNDGTGWCWGSDSNDKLGNGAAGSSSVPVQLSEAGPWDMITTPEFGGYSACGLKSDGTAWCWGRDTTGQLGNGSGISGNQPDPVQVSDAGPWDAVEMGNFHACGIKSADGSVWCWGSDGAGQLGNGSGITGNQEDPVQISEAGPWDMISLGVDFSCGLKSAGTVWCWGSDGYGRLGNGAAGSQTSPMQITEAGPWDVISAGRNHACGVKTDGTLWCWGQGDKGELGNGDTADHEDPVQVSGSGSWVSVSADTEHTCGLKTDGSVWCWGNFSEGRLGIGQYDLPVASPVGVNCGVGAEAFSEGEFSYNADVKAIQYCAGSGMVKVGK